MEELKPIHDGHKSFNGLAHVVRWHKSGVVMLNSYSTSVCCYDARGRFYRLWDGWSRTSMRHVVEFVRQFGRGTGPLTKKEWEALPVEDDLLAKTTKARDELISMEATP